MAAVRLLRRIHRESADGVDAQFVYGATASKIRHSPFTLSAVILTLSLDKNIYHRDAEAAEKKQGGPKVARSDFYLRELRNLCG